MLKNVSFNHKRGLEILVVRVNTLQKQIKILVFIVIIESLLVFINLFYLKYIDDTIYLISDVI